ncbi:hypothetical protein HDV57DRAFT_312361 [Trichoderma longibrachiatum]|uniref:Uncharacterized protein n=1 Tax=Trichoderma longibrachiatum ATCC 18648 TaxID=983965 RepID=A0A2T4CBU4_TRILO|nr:hypothetical protein M440DRAFT_1157386 [Trichoderma longibrachiatum ATCC 18648]
MRAPVWTLPRPMYLILLTSLLHLQAFVITITCSHPSPDMLAVVFLVAAVAGGHIPRYHPRTRPFLATGCRRHQDPVPMRGDIKRLFPYCNGRLAWLLPPMQWPTCLTFAPHASMHVYALPFIPAFIRFCGLPSPSGGSFRDIFPSPSKSYAVFRATSLAYDAALQASSHWNPLRSDLPQHLSRW